MKKNVSMLLIFTITFFCLFSQIFTLNAKADDAIIVYQNDFENTESLNGWSRFGNAGSLSVSGEESTSGNNSMKLSSHSVSWYSPSINIYDMIKAAGAGTYHFSVNVMYRGDITEEHCSYLTIRGLSADDANSFIILDPSNNYLRRISEAQKLTESNWRTFTASIKVLESDIINDTGNFILCFDELPVGNNIEVYFDDIKITMLSNTGITNGDFNDGLTGWRNWIDTEEDDTLSVIEPVESFIFAKYLRSGAYASIACNVDQILSYYGPGEYTLSFRIKAEEVRHLNSPFTFYLTSAFHEYHMWLGQLYVEPDGEWPIGAWKQITLTLNISEEIFYECLNPDEKEVHFRIQSPGSGTAEYCIDDVSLTPRKLNSLSFDTLENGSTSSLPDIIINKDTVTQYNVAALDIVPATAPIRCDWIVSDANIISVDSFGNITPLHGGRTSVTVIPRTNRTLVYTLDIVVTESGSVTAFQRYNQEMSGLCWLAVAKMLANHYANANNVEFHNFSLAEAFIATRPDKKDIPGILDPNCTVETTISERYGDFVDMENAMNHFLDMSSITINYENYAYTKNQIIESIKNNQLLVLHMTKYTNGNSTDSGHSCVIHSYYYDNYGDFRVRYYNPAVDVGEMDRLYKELTVLNSNKAVFWLWTATYNVE